MAPFFSIVVPTLNSEATITACLSNVLSQTFGDIEVVIADGLSTDATRELVAERARADPRVRWDSARDHGIYDAMNRGMSLARGKWLYFMGSDDVLAESETLARVASQSHGQHVMYGSVKIEGDTPWAADGSIYDGRFSLRKLLSKNICHQAMFYRRDFLETEVGGYSIAYKTCADWDLNLRCRAKTPFHYLGMIVAVFRAGGQSTSAPFDAALGEGFVERTLGYFHMSPFHPVALAAFRHRKRELARQCWRTVTTKIRPSRSGR
jgi:glycosyltransferase involved in cell wall biosynthesis